MQQYRTDIIDVELSKLKETPEGWLKGFAFLTSVDVYPYFDELGRVTYEARLPEDVFDKDSMVSMEMLPVTNEHPFEPLDPNNTKILQVGNIGDSIKKYKDNIRIYAPILITDAQTIEDVKRNKRIEISMGYTCLVVDEPGVFRGKQYSKRQKNIRYNHVAITEKGRAGSSVKLVTDSKINALHFDSIYKAINNNNIPKGLTMDVTFKLDGVEYTIPKAVHDYIAKKDSSIQSLELKTDSDSSTIKSLKEKVDAQTARADSAEKALEIERKKDHSEEINKVIAERKKLDSIAQKVMKADYFKETSELANKELKVKIIQSFDENFKADSNTTDGYMDAYIQGIENTMSKAAVASFNTDSQIPVDGSTAPKTPKEETEETRVKADSDIRGEFDINKVANVNKG